MSTVNAPAAALPRAAAPRSAYLSDIVKSRRIQVFSAWCGPAFAVLLFGGWGLMAGFIPLISPHDTLQQVAGAWRDHHFLTLFGLTLAMFGIALLLPFYLGISMQMRRAELRTPVMAILQMAAGVIVVAVLLLPMLVFIVGAFRPERSAELDQLLNDASYIMLILPWPPIIVQVWAISVATLTDYRENPVFPRWFGYMNIWVGFLLVPANMIIFFKTGPFAWTGVIGFWLPAAVFGLWYFVVTYVLLQAIRQEEKEDRAALEALPA
jgi:uncharacterized membrane protein YidH (DUF202 family)